jgi:hypothetical protein
MTNDSIVIVRSNFPTRVCLELQLESINMTNDPIVIVREVISQLGYVLSYSWSP